MRRQYWVAGLSWLAGDALLAAVTKQGSLALLSALGEPVPLLVAGAEASSQPARYLLLHSLLTADRWGGRALLALSNPPAPSIFSIGPPFLPSHSLLTADRWGGRALLAVSKPPAPFLFSIGPPFRIYSLLPSDR